MLSGSKKSPLRLLPGKCYIKAAHWYGQKELAALKAKLEMALNMMLLHPSLMINWTKANECYLHSVKINEFLQIIRNINYSPLLCCHRTIAPHHSCYLISEHGITYVENILCFIVSHCVKSQIINHLSYCLYIIHIDICKSSCLTTYLSMLKYNYF